MSTSIDFSKQIERIKLKLSEARKVDRGLKVFGASSHKYKTGLGTPKQEFDAFQKANNICFPPDFEAFMLAFGYSSEASVRSIAGPFYGIFNLGFDRAIVPDGSQSFLSWDATIYPGMPISQWGELVDNMPDEDEAYDAYERQLMSGVYTLGEQGCSNYHGLTLTGAARGKVVNLDIEYYAEKPPKFAFEDNFLNWYERWLDEVISGVLVQNKGYWFGYIMRGDEYSLLKTYQSAENSQTKLNALNGFGLISEVKRPTLDALVEIIETAEADVKPIALQMLTKFSPKTAMPFLKDFIGQHDLYFKAACVSIFFHAPNQANSYVSDISSRLPSVNDVEAYRFALYVLDAVDGDLTDHIAQGISHSDKDIRGKVIYHLGKRKFLPKMVPFFIAGLNDNEHSVVHAALQALKGKRDIRFLEPYYGIATSYSWDDTYVLQNLEHRLDEIGFRSVPYFKSCYEAGTAKAKFTKYTAGKSVLNVFRRSFER